MKDQLKVALVLLKCRLPECLISRLRLMSTNLVMLKHSALRVAVVTAESGVSSSCHRSAV